MGEHTEVAPLAGSPLPCIFCSIGLDEYLQKFMEQKMWFYSYCENGKFMVATTGIVALQNEAFPTGDFLCGRDLL